MCWQVDPDRAGSSTLGESSPCLLSLCRANCDAGVSTGSVIDALPTKESIREAILRLYCDAFTAELDVTIDPYEVPDSPLKIVQTLEQYQAIYSVKMTSYDL